MVTGSQSHEGGGRCRDALGSFALATLLLALTASAAFARDAYVGNEGSGTVSVIDLASDATVGGPITAGSGAGAIAITPDGKKAYVANHLADSVSAIDTETDAVVGDPIPVGDGPRGIAITPDGKKAYVANQFDGTVSVIDTESDDVVGDPIAAGSTPRGIAISPDGKRAYVGSHTAEIVSVIDTETDAVVGDPIPVGDAPQGIAFTPDGKKAYVANLFSNSVSVIDTESVSVIDTITVGSLPVGIAISPDGSRAYVANAGSDDVSVIDTESDAAVGDPIGVGTGPRGVAVTPDGSRAYVATGFFSDLPGAVLAIDTASDQTVGDQIEIGDKPLGVAIVPNQPPLASLTPAAGTTGQPVAFDASASHDPDSQIIRYDWDFGDGETALDAGPTPTHTFDAAGSYRVTVTLTDSEGCSTSIVFTGLTAYCNGSSLASATSTVELTAQSEPTPPATSPSNAFRIGRLHRDKRGVAKLRVWVPTPGTLLLRGNRVRAVKRTVGGPRAVTLVVRPKRKEMRALKRSGQLETWVKITFRPNGGVAHTLAKHLKLVRKAG